MTQTTVTRRVTLTNDYGLHARPAALFVETCNRFQSEVEVHLDENQVSGKNILNIMTLGAGPGAELELVVTGSDAEQAAAALVELVEGKVGEET